MDNTTVEITLPASLLQFGIDQNEIQHRVVEWLILSLYTDGHISSGKAARLLHMSRGDFIAFLNSRGISYINYTPDELHEDFDAVNLLKP